MFSAISTGNRVTDTKPVKKSVQVNSFFFYVFLLFAGLNRKKKKNSQHSLKQKELFPAAFLAPVTFSRAYCRLHDTCFAVHGAGQMFSRALALHRRSNDNRYKYFLLIILIIKYFF